MKKSFGNFAFLTCMLFLVTLACVTGADPGGTQTDQAASGTEPTDSPVPTTPIPTAVQHEMMPSELPAVRSGLAGDQDSSITADQKRAPSGDRFTFGSFERPFNSGTMETYYPHIDILMTEFYQDDAWIYGVITVKGGESSRGLDGKYAFEIDLDVDGRGDWLILASQPSSTEWTTEGVEVWTDSNKDVGGAVPVNADTPPPGGDGFETLVFGRGVGDDPDLAWSRISPTDPNSVQIAAKASLLGGDKAFMVGMWAGGEDLDPALFDINDHFTHDQAGSPLKEFEFYYPIKEISELDNACRMAIGFQPRGGEPGLCPLPPAAEREPDQPVSCPEQYVVCFVFGNQTVCYCNQP
ncbi:MAG: hypothetical protein QY332_14475 [Anaerolineales bacterium]|nr:MAG: hypothetical protein QY332_14475 [Anaerolineales bacterium]